MKFEGENSPFLLLQHERLVDDGEGRPYLFMMMCIAHTYIYFYSGSNIFFVTLVSQYFSTTSTIHTQIALHIVFHAGNTAACPSCRLYWKFLI